MIKLQFVLGTGLSSKAIAWFGGSGLSHCDAVLPNNELLGARSDRVGHRPAGVEIRPEGYERWERRVIVRISCNSKKANDFYDFCREQIGKPYDSTAIWGFAIGRDWRAPDSWFCSELLASAMEHAEIIPKLCAPTHKITPGGLMLISTAIGGKILT